MGSFDRAKICELARLYVQSKLEKVKTKTLGYKLKKLGQTSSEYSKTLLLPLRLKLLSKK